MQRKQYLPWVTAFGLVMSLAVALPVFAATGVGIGAGVQAGAWTGPGPGHRPGSAPAVFGTVTAVNGTTLTVTSKFWPNMMGRNESSTASAPTVYTVDASNATVYKGGATSTVSASDIATGDTVIVQGTVSGTNVTATTIRDGVMPGMMPGGRRGMASSTPHAAAVPPIQGNGEPVVGGAVTAVNGTTLTVTNASNVTYTIDAASSTIVKNGTTTTIGNVAVGDNLVVQGTVNGTSVTASSIIDQGAKPAAGNASSGTSAGAKASFGFGGIFKAIGGFFQHLFGF